jgi:hypothetical protein
MESPPLSSQLITRDDLIIDNSYICCLCAKPMIPAVFNHCNHSICFHCSFTCQQRCLVCRSDTEWVTDNEFSGAVRSAVQDALVKQSVMRLCDAKCSVGDVVLPQILIAQVESQNFTVRLYKVIDTLRQVHGYKCALKAVQGTKLNASETVCFTYSPHQLNTIEHRDSFQILLCAVPTLSDPLKLRGFSEL